MKNIFFPAGLMGILVLFLSVCFFCTGCLKKEDGISKETIEKLDFTVVEQERLPQELAAAIEEKKTMPFKMTFTDAGELYICVGYGEQKSGGYSIQVNACSRGKNVIIVDTSLLGPNAAESKKKAKSYPYIVLKTKDLEMPVVFD